MTSMEKMNINKGQGMIYEVPFAAGIEAESPKCVGPDHDRDVDGLVVSRCISGSPAAAQQHLLLRTYCLLLSENKTTTKYYSHV